VQSANTVRLIDQEWSARSAAEYWLSLEDSHAIVKHDCQLIVGSVVGCLSSANGGKVSGELKLANKRPFYLERVCSTSVHDAQVCRTKAYSAVILMTPVTLTVPVHEGIRD